MICGFLSIVGGLTLALIAVLVVLWGILRIRGLV